MKLTNTDYKLHQSRAMTHNNFQTHIEDVPPSDINAQARHRFTKYEPAKPIDTGTYKLESPTIKDIAQEREDNPFLRLAVLAGLTGVVGLFLWGIFALLSPKAPKQVVEEPQKVEETVTTEEDVAAELALRDQFHSLETKSEPQIQLEADSMSELPPVTSAPIPASSPTPPIEARPIPRPATPRPVSQSTFLRPVPRFTSSLQSVATVKSTPISQVNSQQQWQTLANFGTGISSRSTITSDKSQLVAKRHNPAQTSISNDSPQPALLLSRAVSQEKLESLNRQAQANLPNPAPVRTLERSNVQAKIELPLVWDSSLSPQEQQSNQLSLVLEEPLFDLEGEILFDSGSVAIVEVQSINSTNGLVSAYVSQINDTLFQPGELLLRNKKKSALVAKGSKRSDFGEQLLIGGVSSLGSFGQQLLESEVNTTTSNGSTTITSQNRNSVGRDLAGSALEGFSGALEAELQQRTSRNQIGDGGTIYSLSEGTTVYITNIKPIKIAP
jgi:hypothetical protein